MRVLVDNCVPRKFAGLVSAEQVILARDAGWHELTNGQLIAAAEGAGFDALISTDKNLSYQQSLIGRRLSIIVLAPRFVRFGDLAPLAGQLNEALADLPPGTFLWITPL